MNSMDKNEKIHNMRHTLAHLLAAAVLELYPDTKNTIGPSIDDGFDNQNIPGAKKSAAK